MTSNAFRATMRAPQLAALLVFVLWGGSAFGGEASDIDGDGIPDTQDNCLIAANARQTDTDSDFCGNACDCDYNQDGICGIADFGEFAQSFNTSDPSKCHVEPVDPCLVSIDDFGWFASRFNTVPGPSGTTPGTIACPLR